jgi:hypothetical protein
MAGLLPFLYLKSLVGINLTDTLPECNYPVLSDHHGPATHQGELHQLEGSSLLSFRGRADLRRQIFKYAGLARCRARLAGC